MNAHEQYLRLLADEIRKEGHNGWGNTAEQAADEIASLDAENDRLSIDLNAARCSRWPDIAELLNKQTAEIAKLKGASGATVGANDAS